MFSTILALHSLVRWLILICLFFAVFRAFNGLFSKKAFSRFDHLMGQWTTIIVYVQLFLGLWLYATSPIVEYFLHNFKESIHQRDSRFFGMEHIVVMALATIMITIGSIKTKQQSTDHEKYKAMATWYTIGLIMILSSIPWTFSPFTSRPYFRPF